MHGVRALWRVGNTQGKVMVGRLGGKIVGSPARGMNCERALFTRFLCSSTQDKQPLPPQSNNDPQPPSPTYPPSNHNGSLQQKVSFQPIVEAQNMPNLASKAQDTHPTQADKRDTVGTNQSTAENTQEFQENSVSFQDSLIHAEVDVERASSVTHTISDRRNEISLPKGESVIGLTMELPKTGDPTNFGDSGDDLDFVRENAIPVEVQEKKRKEKKLKRHKNTKEWDLKAREEKNEGKD
eukprot:comp22350_c0_seq1/m.33267 comp22350_c0_seq1/g.33267  ORF comp22350_c0_seq1/g.33267 comp22350_c0_seq1/m.33267 type:complete len:239 (-) comp22350_c0_seq1:1626-2342(-)